MNIKSRVSYFNNNDIVPDDWTITNLGAVVEIVSGGTPSTKNKEFWNGDVLWATPTDITGTQKYIYDTERKITTKGQDKSSAVLLPVKSVLVTSRATIGMQAINLFPMATNQGFKSMIPTDKIHYEFLYYLIFMLRKEMIRKASGSTFLEISKKDVEKINIALPPIVEQEKIASILSTWDEGIQRYNEYLVHLKIRKHLLMVELIKKSNSCDEKEYKLIDLVSRKKGKPVGVHENGKFPILTIDTLNKMEFSEYTNDDHVLADKKDILLLWDGSNAGSIFTDVQGAVGSTFMRLRPNERIVNSIYIREYMRLEESYIKSVREGSGIPHIPRDFLNYYRVKLPSLEEQNAIACILQNADDEIDLVEKLIEQLQEQKRGLMQLLLTGKVRV